MKKIILPVISLFFCSHLLSQNFKSVQQLAQRQVPWLASQLVFKPLQSNNNNDVFELSSSNNKIIIAANSTSAASMGLGWYLKHYCHRMMSHSGDNLSKPTIIPTIKEKVKIASPFTYRYALNFCTISYSMAFYNWKDWERELDWMALNGVNIMLAPMGTEIVWLNILQKLGFTKEEAKKFFPHRAYTAWWLMGNLENEGGILSDAYINNEMRLQKQLLQRMNALGIKPELQAFYGIVPTFLKNKIKINVIEQGQWAGGYQRPSFLVPTDSMFNKIADLYYSEMKNIYGSNIEFFGGEPFHEGGSTKGIDVSASGKAIQNAMLRSFPNSKWVLQAWGGNPRNDLLKDMNKENLLILENFGENEANWEKRKAFGGTPFIWCNISNFGEKQGLYSKLQRFASEVYRMQHSPYANYAKGIGILPEGIYNNPVNYALTFELGWSKDSIDVNQWIKQYTQFRYGKTNANTDAAWQLLLQTVYASPTEKVEGCPESIFCARPTTENKSVSTWGSRRRFYNTQKFIEAVRLFVKADNEFKNVATYQTDKIDFVRQVLANKADDLYVDILNSIKQKNIVLLQKQSEQFLQMILMQDSLLSTCKTFTLSQWLNQANNSVQSLSDKKQAIKAAKMQITIWGPENNPNTNLHEYAHKEWNGILKDLYYKRWQAFFNYELAKLNNKEAVAPNYFQMDIDWINKSDMYNSPAIFLQQQHQIIQQILN